MQMLSDDLIKGAKGAASYTGLTERSIYHMTEQGLLPVIRKGRSLFYRKSDLDAAFKSESIAA
jgi:excisionase family DNA binding protein